MLAPGVSSSSIRLTPTRWSIAKVRPTATPTSFHAYHNQPLTLTAPDATASLAPTLLASTSSALLIRTERAAYAGYQLG